MRITEPMLDHRRHMGAGAFSTCYRIPNTPRVLLIANKAGVDRSKYEYLEWCMKRRLKYGLHSPEMAMLPEVFEVGLYRGRWYAIVARMPFTLTQALFCGHAAYSQWSSSYARAFSAAYPFWIETDLHDGNWMFCNARRMWVMVDPCADCQLSRSEYNPDKDAYDYTAPTWANPKVHYAARKNAPRYGVSSHAYN